MGEGPSERKAYEPLELLYDMLFCPTDQKIVRIYAILGQIGSKFMMFWESSEDQFGRYLQKGWQGVNNFDFILESSQAGEWGVGAG